MPPPSRVALGGGLVTAVEAALAAVSLAGIGPERVSLFLVACALATALVTLLLHRLIGRRDGGSGGSGGSRGGGPPGDPPPPWWPRFEHDFWDHVHGRDRTPT